MGLSDTNNIYGIIDDYIYCSGSDSVYDRIIKDIEVALIIKMLDRFDGNQLAAARALGIHRNTLSNKIKKLNIDVGRYKK